MSDTDFFDQKMAYYFPEIRSKKWHVRVFIHFIYTAVINSHILMCEHLGLQRGDACFRLEDYIDKLIKRLGHLVKQPPHCGYPTKRRKLRKIMLDNSRLHGSHFPVHVPKTVIINGNMKHLYRARVCMFCKQGRSSFYCQQCNVALHIQEEGVANCFQLFHSANNDNQNNVQDDESDEEHSH